MELDEAMDLSDAEKRALPVDEKVRLTGETWEIMDEESKSIAVYFSAIAVIEGRAEASVVRKVFELAEEDGMDTPPDWRDVLADYETEQEVVRLLIDVFGDLDEGGEED